MTGPEQITKGPLINTLSLEQTQNIIPGHYQGRMTNQTIVVPDLYFFGQF